MSFYMQNSWWDWVGIVRKWQIQDKLVRMWAHINIRHCSPHHPQNIEQPRARPSPNVFAQPSIRVVYLHTSTLRKWSLPGIRESMAKTWCGERMNATKVSALLWGVTQRALNCKRTWRQKTRNITIQFSDSLRSKWNLRYRIHDLIKDHINLVALLILNCDGPCIHCQVSSPCPTKHVYFDGSHAGDCAFEFNKLIFLSAKRTIWSRDGVWELESGIRRRGRTTDRRQSIARLVRGTSRREQSIELEQMFEE